MYDCIARNRMDTLRLSVCDVMVFKFRNDLCDDLK